MFEHKTDPLLPWSAFLRRLATSTILGLSLIVVSLAVGMAGYHACESLVTHAVLCELLSPFPSIARRRPLK